MGALEGRITRIREIKRLPGENDITCKDSKVWTGHKSVTLLEVG